MIKMERSIWALGVAASVESYSRGGYQIPDPVLTNAGKITCMECHFTATRLLLEIAGGAVTTAPLEADLMAPDIKPLVEKYFRGAEPDSAWERLRVFKLIRDLAASEYSGYWNTEIIHGSGSPAAEILADVPRGRTAITARRSSSGRSRAAPRRRTGHRRSRREGRWPMSFRIAVDTGGTFSDVVLADDAGHFSLSKAPTTPAQDLRRASRRRSARGGGALAGSRRAARADRGR